MMLCCMRSTTLIFRQTLVEAPASPEKFVLQLTSSRILVVNNANHLPTSRVVTLEAKLERRSSCYIIIMLSLFAECEKVKL